MPNRVVYDPLISLDLPTRITAASGMNSLAHSVEALYPVNPNPVAGLLADEAIRIMANRPPAAVHDGSDPEARSDVMYVAFLGDLLISIGGVALHLAIGHIVGGLFDIDNGDYNSAVLPHVVAYNAPAVTAIGDPAT